MEAKTNGHQASAQTYLLVFLFFFYLLIIFKTKIIKDYGLQIRNEGYSEHANSTQRSTEKIKDAFPF